MAAIRKLPTGRWLARVYVPRAARTDGRTWREDRSKTFATEREAKSWAREEEGKVERGESVRPTTLTLSAWVEDWLAKRLALRPVDDRTREKYEADLRRYALPAIGGVKLTNLTRPAVRDFAASLLLRQATAGGKPVEGRTLSPRTVRHVLRALGSALADAAEDGLIVKNPVTKIPLPKCPARERSPWTAVQTRTFLNAAADDLLGAYWIVQPLTGMRPSEGLALMWGDVDLERGALRVSRSLKPVKKTRGDGRVWRLGEPKTAKSRRLLSLPAEAVDALKRHRDRQQIERLIAGEKYRDHGFVFSQPNGEPYREDGLSRRLRRVCERANVPVVTPYDLRHLCASLMLESGVGLKLVSAQLGHASITLTADTYLHVRDSVQAQAVEQFAAFLSPSKAGAQPAAE
jgi:integrase